MAAATMLALFSAGLLCATPSSRQQLRQLCKMITFSHGDNSPLLQQQDLEMQATKIVKDDLGLAE